MDTELEQIKLSAADLEFLENRTFQIDQVAKAFRIQEHLIDHDARIADGNQNPTD